MKYFGGIEGGATHSKLVVCDESGECLVSTTGLGTNHWIIGIPECAQRIADMVERAKEEAGIPKETRLASLGLSLSGCEQQATNNQLEQELRSNYPSVSESYVVGSDTLGSVFTASPIGGMVVISGTGSNALLKNPDGSSHSCGGWGNYLGDEGSAWYIAHRAVKTVFDDMDNFVQSPYNIERVWGLIKSHFKVETRVDLLPHCYANFNKPFYASLCKKLSQAADDGDELSRFLFREAGQHIARSINTLLPKVHNDLVISGNLNIVCVGSVWLSWHLLREGFLKQIKQNDFKNQNLPFGLKLIKITKSMAFGACYLGVDGIKFPMPRNYNDNYIVLYQYRNNENVKAVNAANGE